MSYINFERLDWGVLDYAESLARMRRRHADRVAGKVGDALICVEHPRVYTLGKSGKRENILLSQAELEKRGFKVYEVERGGDVTYHGPGQALVYPVIDLRALGLGVRSLVNAVESAVCKVVSSYGIRAKGDPKRPGAWVAGKKIAAIGMAIPKRVTMHGVALNVNTDLGDFGFIKACGLEAATTSLALELGRRLELKKVFDQLYQSLCQSLGQAAAEDASPVDASGSSTA
jgi:lipoate-protein ligase B